MGTFFHAVTLTGPAGRSVTLDALVDTGASFSSFPAELLIELGVRPIRQARLRLADGSRHVQELGEAVAEIDGVSATTIVVFGPSDSPVTIGSHTLQGLMLGVDPVEHRLLPVEGWWAAAVEA
jgi:predicted aspartyl protease